MWGIEVRRGSGIGVKLLFSLEELAASYARSLTSSSLQ